MLTVFKSLLICLLCSFAAFTTHAQNQNNVWVFGSSGVRFTNTGLTAYTGSAMLASEGSASVADRNTGALLFYTDGVTVWNANNQVMPNGAGLLGGLPVSLSSTTAGVIIPVPGSLTRYFLVTVDEQSSNNGIYYNEIDMSLNGGLGDVLPTRKNMPVRTDAAEKAAVAIQANQQGYWLMVHSKNGDDFFAYRVDSTGVLPTPVQSTIGANLANGSGYMKFNPSFTLLANTNPFGTVDLMNFDAATGLLSNAISLPIPSFQVYGVEFSPDGSKLYVSSILDGIYQFDLSSNNAATIQSSRTLIPGSSQAVGLQLGPDCKIYCSGGGLGVINQPNLPGSQCNFVSTAPVSGGPVSSAYGLPMKVILLPDPATVPKISALDSCLGKAASFSLSNLPANAVVSWNFGDPASANNTATGPQTTHVFSAIDTFTVTATIQINCEQTTVQKQFIVIDCTPPPPPPPPLCLVRYSADIACLDSASIFTLEPRDSLQEVRWVFTNASTGTAQVDTGARITRTFSEAANYSLRVFWKRSCGNGTLDTGFAIGICEVKEDCKLFVPNVFTPNQDGLNDVFRSVSACKSSEYDLRIFNRWGQEVFHTSQQEEAWDGRFKDSDLSEGLYTYRLQIKFPGKEMQSVSGFVQLLR